MRTDGSLDRAGGANSEHGENQEDFAVDMEGVKVSVSLTSEPRRLVAL